MKIIKNEYKVLACMSGTSLDGLDIAYCQFKLKDGKWNFLIESSHTITYTKEYIKILSEAQTLTSEELISLDHSYGVYTAEQINSFIKKNNIKPEFIVSHGHTIFHRPEKGFSYQIGNGNDISSLTSLPVIFDIRSKDVSIGGQGAPLVPIGDKLLFSEYSACLNLGGFSNISYEKNGERIAFDICPVNIILNEMAKLKAHLFDSEGSIGRSGNLIPEMLSELNNIEYYDRSGPKSLGKEWLDSSFKPIISKYNFPVEDILRTLYEHISFQISNVVNNEKLSEILITGGGSYNEYLIYLIREQCQAELVIPNKRIIDFKEALIFAFLGVLRIRGENNCLLSVTGAKDDCSGGLLAGF